MDDNQLATIVIRAAFNVRKELGMGLLEGAYEKALKMELEQQGLAVKSQEAVPLVMDDEHVEKAFRADLLVEDQLAIELKTVQDISPVHKAQLLTYLRFLNYRLGLIINFNSFDLKKGIVRVANGLLP